MKRLSWLGTIALATALTPFVTNAAHPVSTNVTLTGIVTCAHCGLTVPKGHTRMSWAVQNVNRGDDIVLITDDGKEFTTYRLAGHKAELQDHLGGKTTLTGDLDGNTLQITAVHSRSES